MPVRTLLIDNYDSYTYNLFHLIAEVNEEPPVVITNDQVTWAELERVLGAGSFDSVVISPGPGTPECAADIGVCLPLLRACSALPVFGVCLGHQALGVAHGARVVRAPEPMHGRLSGIAHAGNGLFAGIPSGEAFNVVRYHSLVVDAATLPACLVQTAWTTDAADGSGGGGVLMALSHASWPHHSVQFHPESVATEHGAALLRNFRALTEAHWAATGRGANTAPRWVPPCLAPPVRQPASATLPAAAAGDGLGTRLLWRRLPGGAAVGSEALFWGLFARSKVEEVDTWWLDSASVADGRARFSFMGGCGGPLWQRVVFRLDAPGSVHAADGSTGTATTLGASGATTTRRTALFALVEETLALTRCAPDGTDCASLPFDFWGGWVGYFGYELRAECSPAGSPQRHASATPDAALFFADRLLAVDHATGDAYALALVPISGDGTHADVEAAAWVDAIEAQVGQLNVVAPPPSAADAARRASPCAPAPVWEGSVAGAPPAAFSLRQGRDQYVADVAASLDAIRAGETYEVCLTTSMAREQRSVTPRALYSALRAGNPAPYAAWMHVGGADADAVAVCCSSPERFLRLDRQGVLEAKPIKGTAPRTLPHGCAADAASAAVLCGSAKDRAENLMIVDLLRNDLGRVCTLGSVHVPALCALESYATVHQLVSTVRGRLPPGTGAVAALRAAFPGGSMTGAPKLRTMAIIDGLEPDARGAYSGALGFLSVNGAADLNIVIRTAVLHGGRITIGAGGAIVALSDAAAEYDEMRLKARAVLAAVAAVDASVTARA